MDSPTVTSSEPPWYLEISGERTGPYRWPRILELARTGRLQAHHFLWRPGLPTASRADAFSELAPLLAAKTVLTPRHACTSHDTGEPNPRIVGVAPTAGSSSVLRKQLLALSAGIVWVLLADTYVALTIKDWPTLIDGILISKLRVFGAFLLLGTGFLALPALWWCVRTRRSVLTGLLRVFAAATAVALIAMSLTLFVNAREFIRVAFGHDPMGQSDVRGTQDGELEVRGPLAAGVAKRVNDWLSNHSTHVIHLNSPGGWIMEGRRLAELIRAHGLETRSRTGCYSACVIAFLAGSHKSIHADARLGFHSTSGDGIDPFFIKMINDGIVKQLRQMGAAEDFVKRTVSTPANDLWMPPTAALVTNHLVDEVATRGFSDSGERLKEFDPRIGRIAASYVFVRHLAASDPTQYASFDRSLRLAMRRKAPEAELYGIVQGLANEIEIGRMPYVSDQIAYLIAQRLNQVSSQFAKNTPAQCVAILGGNRAALKFRSPESLTALVDVEVSLLDAKLSSQPVNTVDSQNAVRAVVRRAMALNPNEVERLQHPRPEDLEGECETLRVLFNIALSSDVSTAAGFLRALRADQS